MLLSVVDHFNRTQGDKRSKNKRAVGVLLGSWKGDQLDAANSFAGPCTRRRGAAHAPVAHVLPRGFLAALCAPPFCLGDGPLPFGGRIAAAAQSFNLQTGPCFDPQSR